jgi:hypothetical protein
MSMIDARSGRRAFSLSRWLAAAGGTLRRVAPRLQPSGQENHELPLVVHDEDEDHGLNAIVAVNDRATIGTASRFVLT